SRLASRGVARLRGRTGVDEQMPEGAKALPERRAA
ncbi:MAG: hypothetical protein JWL62_842, partial [Hyphomicrobiales bacterium]|nr:hypothetical protein [Hyphomicrobiales bacterium]